MASRFWVLGTGNTSDTAHWSATTGGAGGETVPVAGDTVNFDSNSGTAATVTVDVALSAASITINKSDLTLLHNAGTTLTGAMTLTAGTLNTNGQTCSWGWFSSDNANVRTLTLGASVITITSKEGASLLAWTFGNPASVNLTVNAGTSSIICTAAQAQSRLGGKTLYDFSVTGGGSSSTTTLSGGGIVHNLTVTGTAVKTDMVAFNADFSVTGTLALSGNSVTNRLLVQSTTVGAQRTITAAAVSITNVDFMDITGSPNAVAAQTDAFGRADSSTTLGTTDTGQTWSVLSGTWGISSNAAYEPGAVNGAQHAVVTDSGLSDCVVQVTVPVLSGLSGNAGVVFRATDDSNYWRFVIGGATDNNWYFQKKVAGSFSLVGTGGGVAAGDVLRVVLGGNTITVFKNGTQMATTTDSFNSTATKHGMSNSASSAGQGTVARLDDFSVRAVWDLSLATGGSGDCLGNSGITFTTSSTQTATGTASFTWSTHGWTSRVPLPQDDVSIPNAFVASQTVTADMPRLGRDVSFTGCTGSPALAFSSLGKMIFGSYTLAAGMTTTGSGILTLSGRSPSHTFTSAGVIVGSVTVTAKGGTYQLLDDFQQTDTSSRRTLAVDQGTFDANGKNVTAGLFVSTSGFTRAVLLGSGTWSLIITGTQALWSVSSAGLTLTPGTAIISFDATDSGVTKTFAGVGLTYPTLRHTATGSAALTITGNNTFAALDLECTTARTVTFPASGTQTITGTFTALGAAGQLLSLRSSATPTKWYINAATTSAQYCDVKDCTATGTGTPIDNSTGGVDSGNNIGWLFVAGGTAGYSSTLLTLGVG